jgi:hypothetical protein
MEHQDAIIEALKKINRKINVVLVLLGFLAVLLAIALYPEVGILAVILGPLALLIGVVVSLLVRVFK